MGSEMCIRDSLGSILYFLPSSTPGVPEFLYGIPAGITHGEFTEERRATSSEYTLPNSAGLFVFGAGFDTMPDNTRIFGTYTGIVQQPNKILPRLSIYLIYSISNTTKL